MARKTHHVEDQRGYSAFEFDDTLEGAQWSDEELTALALGEDPDTPLSKDAVPLELGSGGGSGLLPSWYMPPVVAGLRHRWWKTVVLVLVFSFLFIEAAGLCSSYGQLVIP
jgi:hypothetical protein